MRSMRYILQGVLASGILIGAGLAGGACADTLRITMTGTVSATDLSRGPYAAAEVGDAVSIDFLIDTAVDIGFDEFHRYHVTDYILTVDGIEMTNSYDPTLGFTTFETFHGFDMASTGLLMPGGGTEHEYRLEVFAASGPPEVWLPQGSTPDDHLGSFEDSWFDFFNENAVVDSNVNGPFTYEFLYIDFDLITIADPSMSGPELSLIGACPGEVTLILTGASPDGNVAFAYSATPGSFNVPGSYPCSGTTIEIGLPLLPGAPVITRADSNGEASLSGRVPGSLCGRVQVQVLDVETCAVSNVLVF